MEEDNNRLKANIGDIEKEKIKLEIQKELKEEELVTLRKRINRQ